MEAETRKIYETAKEEIEQLYNVGTDLDLLARYIAEDISLAVVKVYGKGSTAKYLLDVISNKVQGWCNPALDEDDTDDDDTPEEMRKALDYVREQLGDDLEEVRHNYEKASLDKNRGNSDDEWKVIDLLEEYGDDNELPEGWWMEYGEIDDILLKL